MFKKLLLLLLVLSPLGLTACLSGNIIGPVQGRIMNNTQLPSEQFTVMYTLTCRKASPANLASKCGAISQSAHPDTTGHYTIPLMDLRNSYGNEYELDIRLSPPPENASMGDAHWIAFNENISALVDDVQTLSIFSLKEQKIQFKLASHQSSSDWAHGNGRDSIIEYKFDFSLGTDDPFFSRNIITIQKNGATSESLESIPATLLFVPGNKRVDERVFITANITNAILTKNTDLLASVEAQMNFSENLPRSLTEFSINDTRLPILERSIHKQWNIHLQLEENFFDGIMNLQCHKEKISGSLALTARGGNTWKWSGELPVEGKCQGESGEIVLSIPQPSENKSTPMSIPYDRITGGNIGLQRRSDKDHALIGSDYTNSLLVTTEDSKKLGTARIE